MKPLVPLLLVALLPAARPVSSDDRASAEHDAGNAPGLVVRSRTVDGTRRWTARADRAPLERLLHTLGQRAGMDVEGLDAPGSTALVTVDLVDRPLEQVLEFALGSVGLRFRLQGGAIEVLGAGDDALGTKEASSCASFAWRSATTRFPHDPAAPLARLSLGALAELRDDLPAARDLYLGVAADQPDSDVAREATMRAGRLLGRLGQWSEASTQYRRLTLDPAATGYQASARLGSALAAVHLADPQGALYALESLEHDFPTRDPVERTGRVLVRAMALDADGRHGEALHALDDAGGDLDPVGVSGALLVRAQALEGLHLPGEAAQAWLYYSRVASGRERARALHEAGRLALEAGDELGVLFVCREAERLGLGAEVGDLRDQARTELGLSGPVADEGAAAGESVAEAESLLDQGALDRAAPLFQSLFLGRSALTPEQTVRVTVGWARCLEAREGLDEAIRTLAEARTGAPTIELKARLDVAAADLLEKHQQYDAAIDAYRGRY